MSRYGIKDRIGRFFCSNQSGLQRLVLLVAAFFLGGLITFMTSSLLKRQSTTEVIEVPVLVPSEQTVKWSVVEAVVDSLRNEDNDAYYASVHVDDFQGLFELPLNVTEYRILATGDQIAVLVITNDGMIDYIDWQRDDLGRLQIEEERLVVVLDAGHGGEDHGEGTNDLWIEKEMVFQMSLMMKEQLERAGIRVIMTREEDVYLDLSERVAIANYMEAEMFVSCHLNKMDTEASGVEVLYSSRSDKEFAHELADAIAGEDFHVYRVYNRKGNGPVNRDYYYVHKYNQSPSYIIEFGFSDNEEDSTYVFEHRERLAERAANAIIGYLME